MNRHPGAFRAALHALVVLCVVIDAWLLYLILKGGGFTHDSYAYWAVDIADPYQAGVGEQDAFLYSPAVAQVFALLGHLPWEVFLVAWSGLLLGCVLWMAKGSWYWVLPLPPILFDIIVGNVHILYAAAIVLGFRFPWTWSLMLLTKVTPGIGLLWFAVRREWRALAIALGVTAAIVAVSYVMVPELWRQWLDLLVSSGQGETPTLAIVHVPLGVRLVAAAVLIAWGALTDRPWVLPIALLVAQPVIWLAGLSILVGILPLRGAAGRRLAAQARPAGRPWYRVSDRLRPG
ncbi:MAG: glycosyltransferase family 87 protein [Chloroflexota bacterium]